MAAATPMFLCDAALGRLATWLRLLGYDTLYAAAPSPAQLIARAAAEHRVLLTRNTRLVRRRSLPPHLLVTHDDFRAQVRQVVRAFHLVPGPHFLERCARCNAALVSIDRADACRRVPDYVCRTQQAFARCPRCDRIFWPATHVDRMRSELARMGVASP